MPTFQWPAPARRLALASPACSVGKAHIVRLEWEKNQIYDPFCLPATIGEQEKSQA
jgi:hypothetical protein